MQFVIFIVEGGAAALPREMWYVVSTKNSFQLKQFKAHGLFNE